jgi:uncharacterized protein DUF1963
MDSIELRKKGTDPTGADPNEECTVWVADTTFHWCRVTYGVGRNKIDEGSKKFDTAEEAVKAAEALIAELKATRFAVVDKAAPAAPDAPSPGRPGAVKPAWFAALPKPLLAQDAKLLKVAKAKNLVRRYDEIQALMRPGMDLALKKAKPADLKGVVSRLGGEPDLPSASAWPTANGAPLTFVAQIVITPELKEMDYEGLLPSEGVLSFFAQLDPTADEYGEQGTVLYFPSAKGLVRVAAPAPDRVLKSAGLFTPKARLDVAPSDVPAVEGLGLTRDEQRVYRDDLFLGPIPEGRHHMLLGWGDAATHHDIKGKRFLAQFDSDHRLDFEMGDNDTLRFYIDGDVVDASTVKTAESTLSEA